MQTEEGAVTILGVNIVATKLTNSEFEEIQDSCNEQCLSTAKHLEKLISSHHFF